MDELEGHGASARNVAQVVSALGRVPGDEATQALRAIANRNLARRGEDLGRMAALNALWARGDAGFVQQIALSSADPAIRSKTRALMQVAMGAESRR
jgi:hypothetical protein